MESSAKYLLLGLGIVGLGVGGWWLWNRNHVAGTKLVAPVVPVPKKKVKPKVVTRFVPYPVGVTPTAPTAPVATPPLAVEPPPAYDTSGFVPLTLTTGSSNPLIARLAKGHF